jgi:hypothetical protein
VRVFLHWTVLDGSGGQRVRVHCDGVVHEELDPHGRETHGARAARAVRGRLVSEEELGVVNGQSRDDVPAIQVPENHRAECRFVERDRGVPVADGQHRRDLSLHRISHLSAFLSETVVGWGLAAGIE